MWKISMKNFYKLNMGSSKQPTRAFLQNYGSLWPSLATDLCLSWPKVSWAWESVRLSYLASSKLVAVYFTSVSHWSGWYKNVVQKNIKQIIYFNKF